MVPYTHFLKEYVFLLHRAFLPKPYRAHVSQPMKKSWAMAELEQTLLNEWEQDTDIDRMRTVNQGRGCNSRFLGTCFCKKNILIRKKLYFK